jgi:hypothetical protein
MNNNLCYPFCNLVDDEVSGLGLALSLPTGHSLSAMETLWNFQDESNGTGDVISLTFLDFHPFLLDPDFLFALRIDHNCG